MTARKSVLPLSWPTRFAGKLGLKIAGALVISCMALSFSTTSAEAQVTPIYFWMENRKVETCAGDPPLSGVAQHYEGEVASCLTPGTDHGYTLNLALRWRLRGFASTHPTVPGAPCDITLNGFLSPNGSFTVASWNAGGLACGEALGNGAVLPSNTAALNVASGYPRAEMCQLSNSISLRQSYELMFNATNTLTASSSNWDLRTDFGVWNATNPAVSVSESTCLSGESSGCLTSCGSFFDPFELLSGNFGSDWSLGAIGFAVFSYF